MGSRDIVFGIINILFKMLANGTPRQFYKAGNSHKSSEPSEWSFLAEGVPGASSTALRLLMMLAFRIFPDVEFGMVKEVAESKSI